METHTVPHETDAARTEYDTARIDWLTLVTPTTPDDALRDWLDDDLARLKEAHQRFYETARQDTHGIRLARGGPATASTLMQASGTPLNALRADGISVLDMLKATRRDDPACRATRIDLARDTTDPRFSVETIRALIRDGRIWKASPAPVGHHGTTDDDGTHQETGLTIGSRQSDVQLQIYDKRQERIDAATKAGNADELAAALDMPPTTRWEIRASKDFAAGTLDRLCWPHDAPETTIILRAMHGLIQSRFRILERPPTTAERTNRNLSRVPTDPTWTTFWTDYESDPLKPPTQETTPMKTAEHQATWTASTRSLLTMLARLGIIAPCNDLGRRLTSVKDEELSQKAQTILNDDRAPAHFRDCLDALLPDSPHHFGQETADDLADRQTADWSA